MPRTRRLRDFACCLRRRATPAERCAWRLLRNRRLLGLKFRRQHPVAGIVADFACLEHRVVLELDGAYHDTPEQRAYNHRRDTILRSLGYTVIRLENRELSRERLER